MRQNVYDIQLFQFFDVTFDLVVQLLHIHVVQRSCTGLRNPLSSLKFIVALLGVLRQVPV